jgi:ABC-2 type transport system ATP-binding protein
VSRDVPVVRVQDVSKRFVIRKEKSLKERIVNMGRSRAHREDFWAIRNVSVEVQSGTTVGLIGPNGSGKSTLLKLMGGILQPTSGTIERRGRLAALLELGAGFHPDLTGRENVFLNSAILGLSKGETEKQFDAIVAFSGIEKFIDTQVKFYSSGMYVRLAFAVAVHVDPDVLLVDEVLSVGDEPFQRKCMDRIKTFQHEGRTIILVSHALDQVAELADRALVLEHGNVMLDGDPRDALRLLRNDFEATRQEERQRERERAATVEAQRPQAEITAVSLRDASADGVARMKPGSDLVIDITVTARERMADWILGVSVDSPTGQVVYGTNTKLLRQPMPDVQGEQTFSLCLPDLRLGEGHYVLRAAIATGSEVEIHTVTEAGRIEIIGTGNGVGYLYVEPSILDR